MTPGFVTKQSHWHRLRWQLFWGLIAAVLPFLIRLLIYGPSAMGQGLNASINALWGATAAIFLGIQLIRNIGRYPGIEKASAIIPSFSASFGILVIVFLMLRLDYSRWGLTGAYLNAIFIFYLGYAQVFGRKQLKIAVIPLGDGADALLAVGGIDWVVLEGADPDVQRIDAVAVDLRIDLPDHWHRRVADFALAGTPVYHTKHLIESLTGRVELEHLSETSFGTLSPPTAYMCQTAFKRDPRSASKRDPLFR